MKKIALTAVVIALIASTTSAWSQGPGQGRPGGPMGGPGGPGGFGGPPMFTCPSMVVMVPPSFALDGMAQGLKLSASQKSKLKGILTKSEKSIQPLREKASKATQALRTALMATKYDANKVKSLAAAAEKAEAAIVSANISTWSQIRSVLTADQIKMMQAPMRPAGMRGPGGGQFGPPPSGGQFGPPPGK
ncbi:MAG: Spy/CpxP family protein refolding chaperone [Armatimonadota bacterium]